MQWSRIKILGIAGLAVSMLWIGLESAEAATIQILKDQWGVPHIFADTDDDAFYGLGYASAQDRMFQMELSRRFVQGRLAETLGDIELTKRGETALKSDLYMRTLGYHRHAQKIAAQLDQDTLTLLQAYADGVNAFIRDQPEFLNPLFEKYNLRPEPWTPADSIACWYRLSHFFSNDGTRDAMMRRNAPRRQETGNRQGRNARQQQNQTAQRGESSEQRQAPVQIVDEDAAVVQRADVDEAWIAEVLGFAEKHGYGPVEDTQSSETSPKFSHAWVVGGARSSTGSSVLVSDPQTPIRNPALFYEFHVKGNRIDARGIGVPGSSLLLIGWTRNVAWGVTALGEDQADLFILETSPEHPDRYLYDGEWKPMRVFEETLKVRDGDAVPLKVRETHHGPLFTQFVYGTEEGKEYALHRVPQALEDQDTSQAVIGIMRAANVHEFAKALEKWSFPSVNMLFGDKNGDIGYWMQAAIPVRSIHAKNGGQSVHDGSKSEHEWQGYIPHQLLPHVFNPQRGWIASGNHRPVQSWYPSQQPGGTGSSGHSTRSWRVYELLNAKEGKFTPEDVLAIHFDSTNPAKRTIVKAAVYIAESKEMEITQETAEALEVLKPWLENGAKADLREAGYPIVHHMVTNFRMFGTPLARYGGGESGLVRFCQTLEECMNKKEILGQPEIDYVDDSIAIGLETCQKRYGKDPSTWAAQLEAELTKRPLEYMSSLDRLPSLNPKWDTTFPALHVWDGHTVQSQAAESYTQWISLADVDSALSLLPPGNSELPGSENFLDQKKAWAEGQLHPAPLTFSKVKDITVSFIRLDR